MMKNESWLMRKNAYFIIHSMKDYRQEKVHGEKTGRGAEKSLQDAGKYCFSCTGCCIIT
jgi:hypothetical protein